MGFLVLDETFDAWSIGKKRDDYNRVFHDWHEKDLRAHIRRDRNHPCVVMWSFGNEILEQFEPDGWKLAAHLTAIIRDEDRTRPLTAGFSYIQSGHNGFQNVVDIVGYTYKPHEYANFRAAHPHIPVFDSESASTVSSRGEYFFPSATTNSKAAPIIKSAPMIFIRRAGAPRPTPNGAPRPKIPASSANLPGPVSTISANPRPTTPTSPTS
jgi:beta-galactosidase